ncbi:MAG TPA: class I adenylate-forming enzyme family protein [Myxococcota bacterium]|nr:class I adenylate-forming enzyme family protein [Myxococcota bacterium]HRY92631.1 class I adenylate-forming enzyme family protein [Myxococcota bacterium]HSA24315.1 class I adenylate-forming enzyme family protein [Myxococcota bacterium]
MDQPELHRECQRRREALLPRLDDYVRAHARARPDDLALIEHDTGAEITWRRFETAVEAFAAKLLAVGLRKGDVLATSLPMLKEHVFLEYAAFRVGVLVAPLDLRLKAAEVLEAFRKISPRAYFFLGETPRADFRPIVREVMAGSPSCRLWVQFQPSPEGLLPGAQHVTTFARDLKRRYLISRLTGSVRRAARRVGKRDPALIIFTTGSTGSPKPALLCHESILLQNIGLGVGFGFTPRDRMLVNLPPSHVGGQTEQLMTTLFMGGTAVLLHVFDARKSLEAIQRHKVSLCGQIPALFNLEWRLPDYASFDLSSLRFAIYGGQAVDRQFLERLHAMAPTMGTGLGLTETSGFCTYTPLDWQVGEIADSIGYDLPLCPLSIRAPMAPDGRAGAELPAGQVGEVCFRGPQVFLGYLNDEAATRRAISSDGFLYTGDLGAYDGRGLRFAGRSKFVLKPKGYQVFPGEVESFLLAGFPGRVQGAGCVGVAHGVFSEGIVAFLELAPGAALTAAEVEAYLAGIAAYKRPSHLVFLRPGELPLNRVAKVDYLALTERARAEVQALRARGGWDAAG